MTMTSPRRAAAAALLLAAALTGCAASSSSTTTSPAATPAPTADPVLPFASSIATTRADLQDAADSMADCSVFDHGPQAAGCAAVAGLTILRADAANTALRVLGPPPERLARLVTTTLDATAALAAEDITACTADPDTAGCAGTVMRIRLHLDEVLVELHAWDPLVAAPAAS